MNATVDARLERLHYLDWVRVLTIVIVLLVHSAMPFNTASAWAISNPDTSFVATAFAGFCYQWTMPLFYLTAGAGAALSLRSRGAGRYLKERALRLLVPLIGGLLTIIPLQAYIEAIHRGKSPGGFLEFYPQYFANAEIQWGPDFLIDASHLWFLKLLFLQSVLALPLFLWLRGAKGQRLIARAAGAFNRWGVLFVCVAPLAIIQASMRVRFHGHTDWADFCFWFVFLVYGFCLAEDKRFEKAVLRHGPGGLALGLACFVGMGILFKMGYVEPWEHSPSHSAGYYFYETVRSLNTWGWVLFFYYLAMRFLNYGGVWLNRANEGLLPFYVLHQPFVIIAAFYLAQREGPILVKFLLIIAFTLATALPLYILLIRRFNLLRFLFGMRRKKPAAA